MSLFWLMLGLLICFGSSKMDVGALSHPGPGFFPFLCGILMIGSSAVILFKSMINKNEGSKTKKFSLFFSNFKNGVVVFLSLLAYMFFLNFLGFILCTFLFMGVSLRIIGHQKWRTVILGSFFTSIGAYILFQWLLMSQLPKGIIGF